MFPRNKIENCFISVGVIIVLSFFTFFFDVAVVLAF